MSRGVSFGVYRDCYTCVILCHVKNYSSNILKLHVKKYRELALTHLDIVVTLLVVKVYFHWNVYLPGLLAGPSGIGVGWGIETNGRFEAERPPTLVGPPSGGRAAFQTPLHYLYSTRPHGLVQAIFWHTCPDLNLGPWYCLTH